MAAPFTGRLLVAAPALLDPHFVKTVVLMLEHDPDSGALGVVLTRPSETAVVEILPAWAGVATAPAVVHVGGPVSPSGAIGLAALRTDARAAVPAGSFATLPAGEHGSLVLGTVDLDGDVDVLGPAVAALRIFAGYAGWGVGQLEAEVAEGGWYVVDALPLDPFVATPDRLWHDVLTRQGPPLSLVTRMPSDPTQN
ncbi:MAG TPA: YqgE/AlgH family protein [Mycobacteriales bacterium]